MSDHEQLHAVVHGIVQGVNFRYYTVRKARELKLTGWVRNRPDRTVEVCAEGSHEDLEALLLFINHGPPAATVTGVSASWHNATGLFDSFKVRYD